MNSLTFQQLREANRRRLPQFKNNRGELAHTKADGSDWSPAQWLQAVVGELGEYANIRKKYERGDVDEATFLREAADELADVMTYLDILATQLGIDLGAAVVSKFNRVSERVGSPVTLTTATWCSSLATQNAEFDAVARVSEQHRRITFTPVVDGDYGRVRHGYELAIEDLITAFRKNGRI